mmetsp:Transcript_25835/g.45629  ORF Transcript_25835/g.45629 Transcript_25835/m.45629 type:complete len:1885 (+) Transcript_25835:203-5857(+)
MSLEGFASSFRESNEEIFELLKRGVYRHSPDVVSAVLEDPGVKPKLTDFLHFYKAPAEQAEKDLRAGKFKWAGVQEMTPTLKEFVNQLSSKLKLHQEQTFHLCALFFIKHPDAFDAVRNKEGEFVSKQLSSFIRHITKLYYSERLFLIKAVEAIVSNAAMVGNPAQSLCLEFLMTNFRKKPLDDMVWELYKEASANKLPQEVYIPSEREDWIIQTLQEEKALLELLIQLNFELAHCNADNLLDYLETFKAQRFKGSYYELKAESSMSDLDTQKQAISDQIADLCFFLLLASIKLDVFCDRGIQESFDAKKNPYNLLTSDKAPKIHKFFTDLNQTNISELIGPVILAWVSVVEWGLRYPHLQAKLSGLEINQLKDYASQFYILECLHGLVSRPPFKGPREVLNSSIKYLLKSFLGSLHMQLELERARNYHLLVDVVCSTFEDEYQDTTLRSFWTIDFPNRTGLYTMLKTLSKRFPHSPSGFLQFVSVLIGSHTNSCAVNVVNFLDSLTSYTAAVGSDSIYALEGTNCESRFQLESRSLVIPTGTQGRLLQSIGRDRVLVRFKIEYSLWPVVFIKWENTLAELKQGPVSDLEDMSIVFQYLELICKIIIIEPALAARLEELGSREPANTNLRGQEYRVRYEGPPNSNITLLLLDSFVEFSKLNEPPLPILSLLISALAAIHKQQDGISNIVCYSLRKISEERHGMSVQIAPHPLFVSAMKLRAAENASKNRSVTISVLEFVSDLLEDHCVISSFPLNESNFLREALKFSMSEVMGECLMWDNPAQSWKAAKTCLKIVENLLEHFNTFAQPKPETSNLNNPFIEIIINQFNRVDLTDFLLQIIEVRPVSQEVCETAYENVHWTQASRMEIYPADVTELVRMIGKALDVLDFLFYLLLYTSTVHREFSFDSMQVLGDLSRIISTPSSSDDKLHLVAAMFAYADCQIERVAQEEESHIGVSALRILTCIVQIWEVSSQRPSMHYYFSTHVGALKNRFATVCYDFLMDKGPDMARGAKTAVCCAFLEFLTVAISSQRIFLKTLLAHTTPSGRGMEHILVDLFKISSEPIQSIEVSERELTCRLIIFLNELYRLQNSYPLVNTLMKIEDYLSSVFITVSKIFEKKNITEREQCLALHAIAAVVELIARAIPHRPSATQLLKQVLSEQFLREALKLACQSVSSEAVYSKLLDCDEYFLATGINLSIRDFAAARPYKREFWSIFDSNRHCYGPEYSIDILRLMTVLQLYGVNRELIEDMALNAQHYNREQSILAAQVVALKSIKTLLAVSSAYGKSGFLMSGHSLDIENDKNDIKGLYRAFSLKEQDDVKRLVNTVALIINSCWSDILRETQFSSLEVQDCLSERYQILELVYNISQYLAANSQPQLEELKKVSTKLFNDLPELLDKAQGIELLSFLLIFFNFFETLQLQFHDLQSDRFAHGLIPKLTKFLDSSQFALAVNVLEKAVKAIRNANYVQICKSTPIIRGLLDHLASSLCTEAEFLAVLKFCICYASTVSGAKNLLTEKVLLTLTQAPLLASGLYEYEDNLRNSRHLLWCWSLQFMSVMVEMLADEPGFLPHSMSFWQHFQSRVEVVLSYNLSRDERLRGNLTHQQFSSGYLEELDFLTAVILKYVKAGRVWRSQSRDVVTKWISLISQHTLRLFKSNLDMSYTFPPTSDYERRLATIEPDTAKSQERFSVTILETERGRSLLEPRRTTTHEKLEQLQFSKSVYDYKVESTLIKCLYQSMITLVLALQHERQPILDHEGVNQLLEVFSFGLQVQIRWTKYDGHMRELEKLSKKQLMSIESSVHFGSLNHFYELSYKEIQTSLCNSLEIAVFLLVKHISILKIGEGRQIVSRLLHRWSKITGSDLTKEARNADSREQFIRWAADFFE